MITEKLKKVVKRFGRKVHVVRLNLGNLGKAYVLQLETYVLMRYASSNRANRRLYKSLHEKMTDCELELDFSADDLPGFPSDLKPSGIVDFDSIQFQNQKGRMYIVISEREYGLVKMSVFNQRKKSIEEEFVRSHRPSKKFRKTVKSGLEIDYPEHVQKLKLLEMPEVA